MDIKGCMNFSEIIEYQSRVKPDEIYIHDLSSGREYTFKKFNEVVNRTANWMLSEGIKEGDKITVVIKNSPEYCFFYFAVIRIGGIFNPMPHTSHLQEIKKNINQVNPRLVIIDNKREVEFLKEKIIKFIAVNKNKDFEKSLKNFAPYLREKVLIGENQPACLYYSSGTTADPKGVLFSHKNMITNISSICRGFDFKREFEVHLVLLPLGHTAAINYSLLPCAFMGGKIILTESFWHIRVKIWQLIEEFKVTYLEVVPTVLYSILNIHKDQPSNNLSSLRFIGCGSAPLQKYIQKEIYHRYKIKVANLYGLSETGPTHVDSPLKEDWQSGSIGLPLDVNEVIITNENGKELPFGEVGEIAIKGPNVFIGYFKNDTLYKQVIRDGFFYTGDLGYQDATGRHFFVDRKKDLIIKGGVNIVPGEIDEILLMHQGVKEAVTIGIPDDMFGEEIKCFVVPKNGLVVQEQDIIDFCKQFLSATKIPKEVVLVNKIPKTHSGKLLRKELRKI